MKPIALKQGMDAHPYAQPGSYVEILTETWWHTRVRNEMIVIRRSLNDHGLSDFISLHRSEWPLFVNLVNQMNAELEAQASS